MNRAVGLCHRAPKALVGGSALPEGLQLHPVQSCPAKKQEALPGEGLSPRNLSSFLIFFLLKYILVQTLSIMG